MTEKEIKMIESAFEMMYGYPIAELIKMDEVIATIMRKLQLLKLEGGDAID